MTPWEFNFSAENQHQRSETEALATWGLGLLQQRWWSKGWLAGCLGRCWWGCRSWILRMLSSVVQVFTARDVHQHVAFGFSLAINFLDVVQVRLRMLLNTWCGWASSSYLPKSQHKNCVRIFRAATHRLAVFDVKKHDVQVAVSAAARRLGPFGSRQTVWTDILEVLSVQICRLLLEPASS